LKALDGDGGDSLFQEQRAGIKIFLFHLLNQPLPFLLQSIDLISYVTELFFFTGIAWERHVHVRRDPSRAVLDVGRGDPGKGRGRREFYSAGIARPRGVVLGVSQSRHQVIGSRFNSFLAVEERRLRASASSCGKRKAIPGGLDLIRELSDFVLIFLFFFGSFLCQLLLGAESLLLGLAGLGFFHRSAASLDLLLSGRCGGSDGRSLCAQKRHASRLGLSRLEDRLDLLAADADLASHAGKLDHPTLFPITLHGDAPTVFEHQGVLGKERLWEAKNECQG